MLGLDVETAPVTTDDVKRAFRDAAMRWHPDRQKVQGSNPSLRTCQSLGWGFFWLTLEWLQPVAGGCC
jgi:hypothetical protein